jgi:hypothetical protein
VAPRFVAVDAAGVVSEDGEPEGAGGVILVAFLDDAAAWERLRVVLAPRQGYLGSRRYPDAALVRWSSPLMWARALREPDIAAAADGLDAALYLPL